MKLQTVKYFKAVDQDGDITYYKRLPGNFMYYTLVTTIHNNKKWLWTFKPINSTEVSEEEIMLELL